MPRRHSTVLLPGRPYQLHTGDHVQIRRTLQHPDLGSLRNGTAAQIAAVDPDAGTLDLHLTDDTHLTLTEQQAADADLRLAYVQHPFPAQGHTTDTTHLIIAEHPTREGTYVGLTRARHTTDIYTADIVDPSLDTDRLQALADRMSRTHPDLPSIQSPLAHDSALERTANIEASPPGDARTAADDPHVVPGPVSDLPPIEPRSEIPDEVTADIDQPHQAPAPELKRAATPVPDIAPAPDAPDRRPMEPTAARSWAAVVGDDPEWTHEERLDLDHPLGFEP